MNPPQADGNSLAATLIGILLMVPFVWLPDWTIPAMMALTLVLVLGISWRRNVPCTVGECLVAILFFPVFYGLGIVALARRLHRRFSQTKS